MTTVALSLRLAAALAAGAHPAARRRSPVVHLFTGPVTRSGRFASARGRVLCGVRTLRLPLLERDGSVLDLGGRRFCRRCTALLPASLGRDVHRLVGEQAVRDAYGHLSLDHFRLAAIWCLTVEESHQVGRIALRVLPPADARALDKVLLPRRNHLRAVEMNPEEREAHVARREAEAAESARIAAARRDNDRRDRAVDRRNRGQYLTPYERQLVGT